MKTLNSKEYYASKQDYYLDTENPADCKLQIRFSGLTLYGLSSSANQFALIGSGEDKFYTDCSLEDFVKNWTGIESTIANPEKVLELIGEGWEVDVNEDGQINNPSDEVTYYNSETDEICEI